MKPIQHVLTDIIPQQHQWKLSILAHWESIIGNLGDKVTLEKITTDSLVLAVCHSSWAQELHFLTPVIKEKINALFGHEQIKSIHLKTSGFSKQRTKRPIRTITPISKPKEQKTLSPLSQKETHHLEKITSSDLRASLAGYAVRCKQFRKGTK